MGSRIAPGRSSTAFTTVDLDRPGKQLGFVMIPHSPHDDAWGVTRLPLAVISHGSGPTVIIEGGNHGDEYEGPIVISELIRELDPGEIQGRLILMPAINAPAVIAGQRTSPDRRAESQSQLSRRSAWQHDPADRRLHGRRDLSRGAMPSSTCIRAAPPSTSCPAPSSSRPRMRRSAAATSPPLWLSMRRRPS